MIEKGFTTTFSIRCRANIRVGTTMDGSNEGLAFVGVICFEKKRKNRGGFRFELKNKTLSVVK